MLDKYFPLYVFAFLVSLFVTALSEKKLIPKLKMKAKQPIYTDGPSWHTGKSGTPTMGGLAFILGTVLSVVLSYLIIYDSSIYKEALSAILTLLFALSNALIGVIDDFKKLKHRKNESGLTPKQKILLQIIICLLYLFARYKLFGDSTSLSFSFGEVNIGLLYYPLTLFILLGMINSANLTDGIDGLASSVTFAVAISFFYIASALNSEVALICSVIIGATVGFLFFNLHPAKIFMGDTGSLFFGALVSACAINLGNPLIIIFVGGVYAIEGISVVLQVFSYKLFKKRIFKMSPIHHHLEKCGWSENKICIVAIILTFLLSIPAYIFYLP